MTAGAGSVDKMNYIDDFTLKYSEDTPPLSIISTENETGNRLSTTQDGAMLSVVSAKNNFIGLYNANGILIENRKPQNGKATFNLPGRGLYFILQEGESLKVVY